MKKDFSLSILHPPPRSPATTAWRAPFTPAPQGRGIQLRVTSCFLPLVSCFLLLASCFLSSPAFSADLYLQIQRGVKTAIGFPNFITKSQSAAEINLAAKLQEVTKQDLLYSRLFNLIENGPPVGGTVIDFQGWSQNGTDVLITASVSLKNEANTAQMVASVYELPNGNPIFQKVYRSSPENARRIAHEFSADFLHRFTGERGVSQSRIVFVNNATSAKELYTIDYDGHNLRQLTNYGSVTLLPRWSPDLKSILFTGYQAGNPDIYLYSLETGKSSVVSKRKGLNSSGCFSPAGNEMVVTLSHNGYPNLYLLDRRGKIIRQLTQSKSADTSASFSPDGQKVVFVSDRPGWPQIYVTDIDGSRQERITESGHCDAPVWSPRGDKIAYSKGDGQGHYDIMLYDLSSGDAIPLTQNAGKNEDPSFSPDGQFLIFTSNRNKKRELFIASVDGVIQKKLAEIPGDCFTPRWSP